MPNFSNYVSCYNRVNKTNYRSILQLPKQNLGNINMSNLSYCKKNTDITVKLKGGDLVVKYTDDGVFLSGNAEITFTGEIII